MKNREKLIRIFDAFLTKADPPYKRYHRISDKMAPEVKKQFLESIAKIQKGIDLKKLEAALKTSNFTAAEALVDWKALDTTLAAIGMTLGKVFKEAAKTAGDTFLRDVGITTSLTLPNLEAEYWIADNTGLLITQVGDETKLAVREIILRAQQEGGHPYKTAREIRQLIGLTDRQARAVQNFSARLEATGKYTAEQIEGKAGRYYNKLLKYRSEVIAREETIRAAKEGKDQILRQAIDQGYINTAEWERRFIVTPDDRLCPICQAYSGTIVELDKPWPFGGMTPHVHIQCRCDESVERKGSRRAAEMTDEEYYQHLLNGGAPNDADLASDTTNNIDELKQSLAKTLEKQTGLKTNVESIAFADLEKGLNGYIDDSKFITLRKEYSGQIDNVMDALKRGVDPDPKDLGAVKTLMHEMNHSINPISDWRVYSRDGSLSSFEEAVNEWTARQHFQSWATDKGINKKVIDKAMGNVTAYQDLIDDNMYMAKRLFPDNPDQFFTYFKYEVTPEARNSIIENLIMGAK